MRRKRSKNIQADAMGARFGLTVQRLRKAGKLSLGDLSDQSGVAKSMIHQIEKKRNQSELGHNFKAEPGIGNFG